LDGYPWIFVQEGNINNVLNFLDMANEKMSNTDKNLGVQYEPTVPVIKLVLLFQVLPSLLAFYLLWPTLYQWQLEGSLSKIEANVQTKLIKIDQFYATNIDHLSKGSLQEIVDDLCQALNCEVQDSKISWKEDRRNSYLKNTLRIKIRLDIYDIPIIIEAFHRVPRTMSLDSLEIQQYDELATLIIQYHYYNPSIKKLDWLKDMGMSKEHTSLLEESSKVHAWRNFVEAENVRGSTEEIKQKLIGRTLARNLIVLKEKKGVLMYRSSTGFTLMPLEK
jgi:hypothetical protein